MQRIPDLNDLIGKPYEFKGRGNPGYDCWGLVVEVFRRFGIDLPDYSVSAQSAREESCQAEFHDKIKNESVVEDRWKKLDIPEIPCIVLLKAHLIFAQHIGAYIGYGKFIHSHYFFGVNVDKTRDIYWKNNIKGYYTYVGKA